MFPRLNKKRSANKPRLSLLKSTCCRHTHAACTRVTILTTTTMMLLLLVYQNFKTTTTTTTTLLLHKQTHHRLDRRRTSDQVASVHNNNNNNNNNNYFVSPPFFARNGGPTTTTMYHPFTRSDRQEYLRYYYFDDKNNRMFHPPRVVTLTSGTTGSTTSSISSLQQQQPRTVEPMSAVNKNDDDTLPDAQSYRFDFEQPYYEQCVDMEDWQSHHYPTCNLLHEIDSARNDTLQLLTTRGSWRTVWTLSDPSNSTFHQHSVIVKLLHLTRDYDQESFHYHIVDSISMERLTSSNYVIDEYAFCGQSVITQQASMPARDLVKRKDFIPLQRLKMARDLARGLHDIHSIPTSIQQQHYGSMHQHTTATLMHNDINMANMVVHGDGKHILFNDFNIAVLLKWNPNSNQPCGVPVRFVGDLWRSPEELLNTSYVTEKADVYSLGNVLFQVLTKHQPWTWLEPKGKMELDQVVQVKKKGQTPTVPSEYAESMDVATRVLYEGMQACFRYLPSQRPTAYQLYKGFSTVLEWIETKKKIKRNVTILKDLFAVE